VAGISSNTETVHKSAFALAGVVVPVGASPRLAHYAEKGLAHSMEKAVHESSDEIYRTPKL